MSLRPDKHASTKALVALLEDELGATAARHVERQLADSLDAGRRFEQLLAIRDILGSPLPELEQLDLRSQVRDALQQRQRAVPCHRWRLPIATAGAVLAMACLGLLAIRRPDSVSQYGVKAARAPDEAVAGAGFRAMRAAPSALPVPLSGSIESSAALLFDYTNEGEHPYPYLMLFGLDSEHQVRWFYPAFVDGKTDPLSIAIRPAVSRTLLPDLVTHEFPPGRLVLFGLFTRAPLRVSEVERWLSQPACDLRVPPGKAALLQQLATVVTP